MTVSVISRSITVDISSLNGDQVAQLESEIDLIYRRILDPDLVEAVRGWTSASLRELLRRLRKDGSTHQAQCIEVALRSNGYITRRQVFRITKRDPETQNLTGFTKPVLRITKDLQKEGVVPEDAATVMTTHYGDGVKADGFQVPRELAPLL